MRKPGETFASLSYVHVMAIADKWVMVRRPGCVPFTMPVHELQTWIPISAE